MVPVKLVRTYQQNIENDSAVRDGYLYIAKDTGRVYVDFSDSRVELCAIHAGPGIQKSGNTFTANVTDVVDEMGQSVLDESGVAHVFGGGIANTILTLYAGSTSASTYVEGRILPMSVVATKFHESNGSYVYNNVTIDWSLSEQPYVQDDEITYTTTFNASITRSIEENIRIVLWYQPYEER